jgi:ABC-type glycerol-3-phosphate transport system substrate-binding protein
VAGINRASGPRHHRIRRRQVLALALGSSAGSLLAACTRQTALPGLPPGLGVTSSAPSATAVPLRFLRWADASSADVSVWQSIKQLWTSQSPNVALDDEIPAGNYRAQVLQRLASGSLPDVLTIPSSDLALIAVKGGARPLDQLIGTSRYDLSIFYPVALRESLFRGARYGLPHRGGARVMAFNRALFDRAFPTPAVASIQGCACEPETFQATTIGAATPDWRWMNEQWTWDEFRATASQLTRRDAAGRPVQFGYQVQPRLVALAHWIYANGGEILDSEGSRCRLNEAKAVAAVHFVRDLVFTSPATATLGSHGGVDLKATGRLAMWDDWRDDLPGARRFTFDWDVSLPPLVPAVGKTALYKGSSLIISGQTRQLDRAWDFLQFMTSPDVNQRLVALGSAPPVRTPEVRAAMSASPPQHSGYYLEPLVENYAMTLPLSPHWAELEEQADRAFLAIFADGQEPGVVLDPLARDIDRLLAHPVS